MILTSLLTNEKYFWIKVPRTATIAYKRFFSQYNETEKLPRSNLHMHFTYNELCKLYDVTLPSVTIVRHPLVRFVSGLHMVKYLTSEEACEHDKQVFYKMDDSFLDSTDSLIDYIKTFFGKNCHSHTHFTDIFLTDEEMFIKSFFQTQMYYVYHPNVTWFKYENIHEFNSWISTTLGYDTTQIKKTNESRKQLLEHIDFTNPEFVKHVELMFYDDYKIFNYPFQYLT